MDKEHGNQFVTTQWSMILAAPADSQGAVTDGLTKLCEDYREPIFHFFKYKCKDPVEAEDLCQSFFVELIKDRYYTRASPERGRFRSFLLGAAKHHFLNYCRSAKAQKRGAGSAHVSLEDENLGIDNQVSDPSNSMSDERFDHAWAHSVFKTTWDSLELFYRELDQMDRFVALRPFLTDPENAPAHKSLAEELGVSTGAIKTASFELRRRFRETFRTTVARLVDDPLDVDAEVRYLVQAMAKHS